MSVPGTTTSAVVHRFRVPCGRHPHLRRARKLVRDGAVHHVGQDPYEVSASGRRHTLWVPPGPADQAVSAPSCTCAWGLRHGTDRSPCAHVLAVLFTRGTVTDDQEQTWPTIPTSTTR